MYVTGEYTHCKIKCYHYFYLATPFSATKLQQFYIYFFCETLMQTQGGVNIIVCDVIHSISQMLSSKLKLHLTQNVPIKSIIRVSIILCNLITVA